MSQGSGTITALNGTVIANIADDATVVFNITGAWSATLTVQASVDGINFFTVSGYVPSAQAVVSTFSVNEAIIISCAGFSQVQLVATSFSSGTVNIAWASSSSGSNALQIYGTSAQSLIAWVQLKDGVGTSITSTTNGSKQPLDIGFSPRSTYMAASVSFTPAATPTDVFTIVGSASKTVKVWRIEISSNQTLSGTNNWFLIKRSAVDTGGTKTTLTNGPVDSTNAVAMATVSNYTANPTSLGASVATLLMQRIVAPAPGSLWNQTNVFYDADECMYPQPITLRGTSEVLAVNFNGAALPGGLTVNFSIVWTEE